LSQRTILRIANKQDSENIATREIRSHVEFTGIPRRRDRFRDSEKPQFVSESRIAAPADLPSRACELLPAFEFNRVQLQQKGRESARCNLRLADDEPGRCEDPGAVSKLDSELLPFGVAVSKAMLQKKPTSNNCVRCNQVRPTKDNEGTDRDTYRNYEEDQ